MSLNNPSFYHFTRHNVGSWWIRSFCLMNDICMFNDKRFSANIAYVKYNNFSLFILESTNYINCYGSFLIKFLSFNNIMPHFVLIVHDDLDLLAGNVKLKYAGGSSGHNGLLNVISALKTSCFFRLRIGIGSKYTVLSKKDYVLSEPELSDKKLILSAIKVSLFFIDDILNLNFSCFRNKIDKFFKLGENNV